MPMNCPQCNAPVPDGVSVCPSCQAHVYLDGAWADPGAQPHGMPPAPGPPQVTGPRPAMPPAGPNVTGPHAVPPAGPNVTGPHAVPPAGPNVTGPHAAPSQADIATPPHGTEPEEGASQQASVATRVVALDPQAQRGTQIVDISLPAMVRNKRADHKRKAKGGASAPNSLEQRGGALELEESLVSRGIDDIIRSWKLFYARLHRFDRWTLWAALAAFLAAFLPWVHITGVGLRSGVEGYGVICAAVAGLTVGGMYMRTARRRLTGRLLTIQLLLSTALVAVPIYRYLAFADIEYSFGIYLSAAAGVAVVVTTLARLTRISS